MNDVEPTQEEQKAAVQQAIRNQIEGFHRIASDMDASETRVALAIMLLNTNHLANQLSAQIAQLAQMVTALKQPSLFDPMGQPIIQP